MLDYRVNMFKKFKLTKEENEFIKNVDSGDGLPQGDNNLAIFYLAKQIEESSKLNDKSSKRMFWLTIAIAFFGACQVIVAIINIIK